MPMRRCPGPYRLKSHISSVRITLMRMHVVMGKKNETPGRCTEISPGNRPSPPSPPVFQSASPARAMTNPPMKSSFPISRINPFTMRR